VLNTVTLIGLASATSPSYAALGEALGLSNDWAARIIHHVGNYGEVFDRNLGPGSKLGIPRGLNRLWTDGGFQYAPPMR
jgi:general L-amino acid transport system substrate-binding protein